MPCVLLISARPSVFFCSLSPFRPVKKVLTFDYKKHLWSMAVCDTAPIDAEEAGNNGSSHRDNQKNGGGPLRVTILEEPVMGKAKLPGVASVGITTPSTTGPPASSPSAGTNNSSDSTRVANSGPAGVAGSGGGGFSKVNAGAHAVAAKGVMPHQRHGHTCFVWDPRDPVLTSKHDSAAAGSNSGGRGGGLPSSSPQRGQKKVRYGRGSFLLASWHFRS